jgi:hypothetical protein
MCRWVLARAGPTGPVDILARGRSAGFFYLKIHVLCTRSSPAIATMAHASSTPCLWTSCIVLHIIYIIVLAIYLENSRLCGCPEALKPSWSHCEEDPRWCSRAKIHKSRVWSQCEILWWTKIHAQVSDWFRFISDPYAIFYDSCCYEFAYSNIYKRWQLHSMFL